MTKINKKWFIVASVFLILAGYFGFKMVFNRTSNNYITEKAVKGEVLQEISETGNVKATESINLGFKNTGRIERINVVVGSDVKKGDIIAKIETSQLSAQLQDAKAALVVANSQRDKLLNGPIFEDIKISEDAKNSAQQDLDNSYGDALSSLNDAYIKIYNSYTTVNSIENSYFGAYDQQGIKVQDSKNKINEDTTVLKSYLDKVKISDNRNDIDSALSQATISLSNTADSLKIIRDVCDEGIYYYSVSSADKSSIDTQRGNINTALASINDTKQTINSYKIAFQKKENELILKKAPARQEDISVFNAQVSQAEARINLLEQQISDNYLRSPIDGKVTKINNDPGEIALANDFAISMLSNNPFQIKADIYEQDIVNVKVDDSVIINLIAFPDDTLLGKVVLINPAEKIVDNIVYYEVTIDFPNRLEGIKSGMTADIVIETNKKEDVLIIPKNAVEKINGKDFVQILTSGKVESREIVIGLKGNYYYEVISGVNEGDEIIIGTK